MTWRKILSKIGVKFYVSLLLTMCRIMGLGDGRISKVPTSKSKVHKHPQCPESSPYYIEKHYKSFRTCLAHFKSI